MLEPRLRRADLGDHAIMAIEQRERALRRLHQLGGKWQRPAPERKGARSQPNTPPAMPAINRQ